VRTRISWLVVAGVSRALTRADRLSLALRARCLSWNATLPRLSLGPPDLPVLVFSVVLVFLSAV